MQVGAVGVVLMQGGKLVCYHFEMFHGGVLNYPTYDKELYVQVVKKWKHYLIGKLSTQITSHYNIVGPK